MKTHLIRAGATLVAVLTAGLLTSQSARASCAPAAPLATELASAPAVFVGTVISVSDGERVATVRVSDVWRGSNVSATVQVVGSPDLGAAATSVDRTYLLGERYLFVPGSGAGSRFEDNICTATRPYAPSLAALRPAQAPGAPALAAAAGSSAPWIVAGGTALALAAAAIGVGLLARRPIEQRAPVGDGI